MGLVLKIRKYETVHIGENIHVKARINPNGKENVEVSIDAPPDVKISRTSEWPEDHHRAQPGRAAQAEPLEGGKDASG